MTTDEFEELGVSLGTVLPDTGQRLVELASYLGLQLARYSQVLSPADSITRAYDMALHKVTKFTETRSLELRLEMFNVFNHAQFYPNGSVDANIDDTTFGQVRQAADPRIGQIAAKFTF